MANKIKMLIPRIISKEKTRFVLGRSILDGISIIQETIHSIINTKEAYMFMKLDIQKDYEVDELEVLMQMSRRIQIFPTMDKHNL